MDRAKEVIAPFFGWEDNIDKYKNAFKYIDERWLVQLHRPLHAAYYYFNPTYFNDIMTIQADEEVQTGLSDVIAKLVDLQLHDVILKELGTYRNAGGLFWTPTSKEQSKDNLQVQGYRFDPHGDYVRTWLPELARMPTEWIHHPWNAPKSVLEAAGVELGVNYPKPLVDIDTARERLDDAVAMMWQLDSAARVSKLNGSNEVVEDNLLTMKVLDIPKVVVKKEVSVDTSSLDQRVPSFQNLKSSLCETGSKKLDDRISEGLEINDQKNNTETAKIDEEDLLSTAESSSAKKRSYNESQCAVPTSFVSSSCGKTQYEFDSFKLHDTIRAPSVEETDGNGLKKVEEDEAQSSIMGFRPTKRHA